MPAKGIHASVIYDVPEPRPVPLPDMICASPTGVTGPYRALVTVGVPVAQSC